MVEKFAVALDVIEKQQHYQVRCTAEGQVQMLMCVEGGRVMEGGGVWVRE
jgi:hypothetical protein